MTSYYKWLWASDYKYDDNMYHIHASWLYDCSEILQVEYIHKAPQE